MIQRLNLFFRKFAVPAMWCAGGLILGALLLDFGAGAVLGTKILYIAAFLLAGIPILFRAIQGLRFRVVGIEALVSLAVIGACAIGEFSEAAIVTFLFQFGAWLEQKTMTKTRSAIKALTELAPKTAWRLENGEAEEIDAEDVEIGDRLLVKTGGQIPADGVVVKGEGHVNEAGITGESMPKGKNVGSPLYAGTILESGAVEMKASRVGEDTTFSKIIQLVEEAQDAKSPVERFIDRFARYYTPCVVLMAILTLIFTGNLNTAITVLVLACPGALVIGAPIANVAGIGRGAKKGILLKGGDTIYTFAKTNAVCFDKTGTLTMGKPRVMEVTHYGGPERETLSMVCSAEGLSDHPLAKAISDYGRQEKISLYPDCQGKERKGLGMEGLVHGHALLIGSEKLLLEGNVPISQEQRTAILAAQERGATTVLASVDGRLAMIFSVFDGLRPEAKESISRLKRLGVSRVVILTGDNDQTARAVAREAGITELKAQCLPQDKVAYLKGLQKTGATVTFVGDGINDSPALAEADTGIAMGSGTDVAVECSDVVLIRSDLNSLVQALALAKKTKRLMYQNIAIAVGTVVLLLVGLFAGFVHMALGMLIHEASILIVILNAMRLLFFKGEKK